MLFSVVISHLVAFTLYKSAPEKNEMSFNKYLNAMMMDVSFKKEKMLLVYESDRLKLFQFYRVFILGVVCMAFGFALALFVWS